MEIAGAVVGSLTQYTITVIENEVSYASDCKAQLDILIQNLNHVNGLLHDKENLKLNANHVKPAMIPLRKLIYEADDVITDCIVRDEYGKEGIASLLCRLDLKFLHSTGKKLKDINTRLNTQLETLGTFLRLKEDLKDPGPSQQKFTGEELMSQDFNPNVVIGLDEDIDKIRGWIVEPNKFGHYRIAVTGMGGLGKTTVVQKIFSDPEVVKSYDMRIWVSVSKNFSEYKILTSILRKLGGKIPQLGSNNSHVLREVHNAVLKLENGCLVVLDDVWSIENAAWWSDLCKTLEVEGKRSCVIVTTRITDVAKIVVRGDEDQIHKPRPLDKENSWLLFSQFACPGPAFEGQGRKIVEKCGGLPLSIKTIGSLLAGKTDLKEWTEVLDYFHNNETIGGNQQVIENLRLSYNDLEAHLKQCLLCFCAYPEDSEISADQVIHWWLADGLLHKKNSEKSALALGREYLSALISRCLVEADKRRPYDGRVYTCKIHDMVRELIMKIAEEEGFCCFNEKGIPIWNKESYWLCLTSESIKQKESTGGVRGTRNKDKDKDNGKCLFEKDSKLRAVLLMPGHQMDLNKDSGVLSSLRMLDLSGGSINQDPKSLRNLLDWIGALTRLACLNLTGFEGLEELPSSIYKLRNLQLLVLTGCSSLKKIDEYVAKLKKLVVLHLENCSQLEYLPRGLEELWKLQELSGFKVTIGGAKAKGTCGLAELANLIELRVLHIVISSDNGANLSELSDQLKETLSGLRKLKTLGIDAQKFRNGLHLLDSLCPPETLKELYLRNYRGNKLPEWINPSRMKQLQYLCIEDTENVTEWNNQPVKWEVLQGLRLKDMKKLTADWTELKKAMPALTYLEVIKCDLLKNLPLNEMKDGIWRSPRKRT